MPYTITKPKITYRGANCPDRVIPAETRTFTTAAGLLRFCLNEGVFSQRYVNARPKRFEHLYAHRQGTGSGGYFPLDTFCQWKGIRDHMAAMVRAHARYCEILHYLREVEPEWRPDVEATGNAEGIVHYADNSTERHEINKYGKRRHVMITAPSGDACF
jgi:hypothetical protein